MDLKSHRVLIVEDEALIAFDLVDIVRGAGGTAIGPASSVKRAHRELDEHQVTAAILDVNLVNENSLEVAKRLRRAGIPFIYHSGHFIKGDPAWPLAPLARKPAEPRTLIAKLVRATRSIERPCADLSG